MPRWLGHTTGEGGSLSTGRGFTRKDACLNDFLIAVGFNFFPPPKGAVGLVLLFMPWTNAADACWERRNPLWSWGSSYLKTLGREGCGEPLQRRAVSSGIAAFQKWGFCAEH